jgi:hypothetical protein
MENYRDKFEIGGGDPQYFELVEIIGKVKANLSVLGK